MKNMTEVDKSKKRPIGISMTPELHYKIKKYAIEKNMKMNEFIEKAVDEYMKNHP